MKGRGGRQSGPPTNHTILQKYDFFASLRAACADFQAPRRRVARKKPCERRFSTTFGEKWTAFCRKSTTFGESPPLLRRRRTFKIEVQQIIRFFIGANLCLQMRFFVYNRLREGFFRSFCQIDSACGARRTKRCAD